MQDTRTYRAVPIVHIEVCPAAPELTEAAVVQFTPSVLSCTT